MNETFALPLSVVLLRLVLAFCLGGIIGLERERRDRPAGLRTHILVTLSGALLMMLSEALAGDQFDPGRIAAGVVTGIGFLGAGTIIHYGADVRGLTTAATIWAASAVGLTVGAGWYPVALVATILIFFTLTVMRWVEPAIFGGAQQRRVQIRLVPGAEACTALLARLREAGVVVTALEFTDPEGEELVLACEVPRRMHKHSLLELIVAQDEVAAARLI